MCKRRWMQAAQCSYWTVWGDVVVSALEVFLCLGGATVKLLTYIVPTERLRITFQMVCLVLKSLDRIVRPAFLLAFYSVMTSSMSLWAKFMSLLCLHLHVDLCKQCRTFMLFDMSMRLAMLIAIVSTTSSPVDTLVSLVIGLSNGCKQPRPPIVVRHSTTGNGRFATISTPTLDRLKLRSMVS